MSNNNQVQSDIKTVWCDCNFSDTSWERLRREVAPYRLVTSAESPEGLAEATIAFGQPDAEIVRTSPHLRWAHITSAGYTRYDRDDVREAFHQRGAILTNSSSVFDEPCAQHTVAMLLAMARHLPHTVEDHRAHIWDTQPHRVGAFLLDNRQTVLLLGFGAIVRRIVQLLAPYGMRLIAVRKNAAAGSEGLEGVEIVGESELEQLLPQADQIINVLPESPSTTGYFSAERFALLKPSALFYNIGRGATVDQEALIAALTEKRLAGAYLDVVTPEPLHTDNPLWDAPNCWITPHSAGGHVDEEIRLIDHFLKNFQAFEQGKPLNDRRI